LVFLKGKIRITAELTPEELRDWHAEMAAIATGRAHYEMLAITIRQQEIQGADGWYQEKKLRRCPNNNILEAEVVEHDEYSGFFNTPTPRTASTTSAIPARNVSPEEIAEALQGLAAVQENSDEDETREESESALEPVETQEQQIDYSKIKTCRARPKEGPPSTPSDTEGESGAETPEEDLSIPDEPQTEVENPHPTREDPTRRNDLVDLLERLHQQRLANTRDLAGGASHEASNLEDNETSGLTPAELHDYHEQQGHGTLVFGNEDHHIISQEEIERRRLFFDTIGGLLRPSQPTQNETSPSPRNAGTDGTN
jgi:hypothetical protein